MSVRTVAAASTSFLLREQGSGPGVPVLLLHGVPETSSCWQALAPQLATGRRVLAPDLPGLGGSSYGGPYDVPSLVDQLVALLETETDGGPVDLVGHDWGGSLALALAGMRPDLVRRLVVANAPYRKVPARAVHIPLFALPVAPELFFRLGGSRAVRLMLGLGWRSSTPLDPERRAEYEAAYAHRDQVRAMLGYYRAAARPRLAAAVRRKKPGGMPRVRAEKMLVLWGAKDPVLPISTGESVVSDLGPECVMVTVPGAGHFVIEEAPEVVAQVLVDFLSEASAGAAPPEGPDVHRVAESDPPTAAETPTVGLVPVGATPAQQDDDAAVSTTPSSAATSAGPKRTAAKKTTAKKTTAEKAVAPTAGANKVGKVGAKKVGAKKAASTRDAANKAAAERAVAKAPAPEKAVTSRPPAPTRAPASKAPRKRAPEGGGPEVPPSPGAV